MNNPISLIIGLTASVSISTVTIVNHGIINKFEEQPKEPKWELAWAEEFAGTKLDDNIWTVIERGKADWHNTMSDDPRLLKVSDSVLTLRGIVNDQQDEDQP